MINSNHNAVNGYDKYLCFYVFAAICFVFFRRTTPLLSSNLELNSILDEVFSELIEMLSNFLANISVNGTWQIWKTSYIIEM